ncbi:MAG: alpha-L-rhamnosidase C-terminal domain-containing protein [Prolixibacteraceae bacterium]|nr:alpha-L-rhamnosidase C-terminal domain-containing protein [Prolixibacteraceae bacterium]
MKNIYLHLISLTLCFSGNMYAQKNILHDQFRDHLQKDVITRSFVTPVKIVWQSDHQEKQVKNSALLLTKFDGQLSTGGEGICMLKSDDQKEAAILLDFGSELYGGIEIAAAIRSDKNPVKIRVRLGESVSEAMSNTGDNSVPGINSATNDHSMRDFTLELPWLGTVEIGNSGFRFVRIDLLDKGVELPIRSVRAIARYRDIPYLGSFRSSDERLNKIWETGAYTVHLNMQDYLWDGIKRDRLVWVGDMHPEVMTINSVFGDREVVRKSLDFARDTTPLPGWMNGISSYSLWWIIIHRDHYLHQGDLNYLREQQKYLKKLIPQINERITEGKENLDGGRFLDWPTSEMPEVIHSGLQALTVMAMEAGEDIANWLEDPELQKICAETVRSLRKHTPTDHDNKQAAALLALADLTPLSRASTVILREGANDFATFYGYYMLEALAKAGKYQEGMNIIADYWGAMLDLGATTFWEHFDFSQRRVAARIDQITAADKFDIHADGGAHCYIGLRGSLCHGWASGPTSWLTTHVLGFKVMEPGSRVIQVRPNLGNLAFAEGTFPTPYGIVKVKHVKQADGKVKSEIDAPKEVKIIK